MSVSVSPWHFFHWWTRWSKPVTVTYTRPVNFAITHGSYVSYGAGIGDPVEFTHDEQTRECVICGAVQMRRV